MVVTFNSALIGATNKIKVATNTVKDTAGNVLATETATAKAVTVTLENIPGHVVNLKKANTLLLGEYAFELDNTKSQYTLNNDLKAAHTAYNSEKDINKPAQYHIYYYTGSAWYDLVNDATLTHPISNLNDINNGGMFLYKNMQK